MDPHNRAIELAAGKVSNELNEANTRHQIIDVLLHEVLGWPRNRVSCEDAVNPGYIDYHLQDAKEQTALLIEAKKQSAKFTLPTRVERKPARLHRVKLRSLMTAQAIGDAVAQVAIYATTIGAKFAAITNGHTYIIFHSFIPGKDYRDADALVIPSLRFFSETFTEAENLLSFTSITTHYSLTAALEGSQTNSRAFYYPKDGVDHYDAPLRKNDYAKFLDPLAKKYFSDISINDKQLMEKCYVYASGSDAAEKGIKSEVLDVITPFLKKDGGTQIESKRTGGALTKRIANSLAQQQSEVLILFGGKGAGKSTFLRRLFYYDPPTEFELHLFPIIIDLLRVGPQQDKISDFIWQQIVQALDLDDVLNGSLEGLERLFSDRLKIAIHQELSVYEEASLEHKKEKVKLISEWKHDPIYVAKSLIAYWRDRGKGVAIAFDNTDQMQPSLQDFCFLQAQNIAAELGCISIISMREERYCRARTMGVLDAYYNVGYHLSAPDLTLVFEKRLKYAVAELQRIDSDAYSSITSMQDREGVLAFLKICLRQFKDPNNALTRFLRECARSNTRLALEFFRQFVTSGYTNVDEMIQIPGWTVSDHQVIKPMMIPERFNYDETKSIVPNLFQCRNARFGSHFTALRILAKLRFGLKSGADKAGFKRVDALSDEFESNYRMKGDFISSLDVLLRHGMIEANNGLDTYSVKGSGDQDITADEIRITAFGVYSFDFLVGLFAYLDLVSMDCGLASETLYTEFCESARAERNFAVNKNRRDLLSARIARVEKFVAYLKAEESREAQEMQMDPENLFMGRIATAIEADLKRVRKSANQNLSSEPSKSGNGINIGEAWDAQID
jgi:hypothetical protein